MIRCSAVQLRQSRSGTKRANLAYFNAVAERFAKDQIEAVRLGGDRTGDGFH